MVLINLPAQVFRAGFAQTWTAFSASEGVDTGSFRLSILDPVLTKMTLSIPQRILGASVSFTLQTTATVNVLRVCTATLKQNDKAMATYQFTATNLTPILPIVEQTLSYPALLQSGDVFTFEVKNEGAPLVDIERIQFLGTISVQGTPI